MQPNLLIITTDQQRYDCLGANGNPDIRTPHLDALARDGVNLHGHFANSPVCVPSRCTLFTGRYPGAHRIRENHNVLECGREIHLFRALKHAGYRIGYVGKNHLLENEEFGDFDYTDVDGFDHAATDGEKWMKDSLVAHRATVPAEKGLWGAPLFHDLPDECMDSWVKASSAIRFLEETPSDRPFCLYLSFHDPHVPHKAPRRFEALYPPESLTLYPHKPGELDEKARRFRMKQQAQRADAADEAGRRHYLAVYYAMISFVDEQVGRVREALRRRGADANTIVVFTSDHGEFAFEHGLYKKDLVLLDSLLRVPMIVSWPCTLAPREIRGTLTDHADVMPTLLDLAQVETPFGVQGRSFAGLLRGETDTHRDAVYSEVCPPWLYNEFPDFTTFRAYHEERNGPGAYPFNVPGDYTKSVRTATYRYTWYGNGEEELYDRATDPEEQHNVARLPEYRAVKTELKLQLLEWHALQEDPLDPLSVRQLQRRYGAWRTAQITPGATAGPYWLESRFRHRQP